MKAKLLISFLFFLLFVYHTASIKAAPPSGNYLELNGGYIKANNQNLNQPSAATFEAWIKPQSIGGIQHLLTIGDISRNKINYQLSLNGGSLQLTYYYSSSSLRQIASGNLQSGSWQHVAAVISADNTRIYINGLSSFNAGGATGLK